eukprot:scaffold4488_cov358-Prasinococcus_capsulatus_cf.AAC.5
MSVSARRGAAARPSRWRTAAALAGDGRELRCARRERRGAVVHAAAPDDMRRAPAAACHLASA